MKGRGWRSLYHPSLSFSIIKSLKTDKKESPYWVYCRHSAPVQCFQPLFLKRTRQLVTSLLKIFQWGKKISQWLPFALRVIPTVLPRTVGHKWNDPCLLLQPHPVTLSHVHHTGLLFVLPAPRAHSCCTVCFLCLEYSSPLF